MTSPPAIPDHAAAAASPGAARELAQNARVLAAATLGNAVGVQSALYFLSGVFIAALHADLGWSTTALSIGPTLLIGATAVMVPLTGRLADRANERWLILLSLTLMAACFLALGHLPPRIELWYILMTVIAVVGAGASSPVFSRLIGRTFVAARGTALAISITGTAIVAIVAPPLFQHLIAVAGWRAGYLALAGIVLASIPVIHLLLRNPGGAVVPAASHTVARRPLAYRRLLRDPIFIRLTLSGFLVALASGGMVVHFVPMLIARGMTGATAAWWASLIGATLFVARLGAGVLMDRIEATRVAIGLTIVSAAGYLAFALGGNALVLGGVIACGVSVGAEYDIVGYLTMRYFPVRAFGQVFGLIFALVVTGSALSTMLYGYVSMRYGYDSALFVAAAIVSVAALLILTLPKRREWIDDTRQRHIA